MMGSILNWCRGINHNYLLKQSIYIRLSSSATDKGG
jgi:hypothetical protein